MKISFIGTGAAHDPRRGNVSFLYESGTRILVDCGFMNVARLIEMKLDPDLIDAIYISHSHADHFTGLVPFVSTLCSGGRTKPLTIIGHAGVQKSYRLIEQITEREMYKHQKFELTFIETVEPLTFGNIHLRFALTSHGAYSNYSVMLDDKEVSLFYSGDGRMTEDSKNLMSQAHVLIHNTKTIDVYDPNHASICEVLDFVMLSSRCRQLFCTHVHDSYDRTDVKDKISKYYQGSVAVHLPEPGEEFSY